MNKWKNTFLALFSSIRTKLLVSFSLVIIISVTFVTYFPITAYSKRLASNNIVYSNQVIINYINNVNNYIHELDKVIDSILYNFNIQRHLIEKQDYDKNSGLPYIADGSYSDYYQGSTDALSNIINLRSDITSIFILDDHGMSLYKSRYKNINLEAVFEKVMKQTEIHSFDNGSDYFSIDDVDYYNDENISFSITKDLDRYDGQGELGLIHIDTDLSVIEKIGDSTIMNEGGFLIVIDDSKEFVYKSSPVNVQTTNTPNMTSFSDALFDKVSGNDPNGYFIHTVNNITYQFVYQTIVETGWIVATITPYDSIMSEANEIRNTILLISLLSLIIILFITFVIATRITKPIIALKKSMDDADRNGFNEMVEVNTQDEIGILSLSFNHMVIRIKSLMDEVVKEQEEKRTAEIKVLQDQINPHFLYNTLDTIIWMSETGDENTVPMIEALSQLFRISLSRGQEFITIEDELQHINHYLYILRTRYLNKFDYTIDADSTLLKFKIPKIILQPLIENAIYHGIKNISEKGQISVNVSATNKTIIMSVTDNGIGMDVETCNRLLNEEHEQISKSGSGVGIRNVNRRIKLYYGEDYGLKYYSTEGYGTTVTVTFPYDKESSGNG